MNYLYIALTILFLVIGGYMTYKFLYNNKNKNTENKKFIPNKEFELKDKTNGDLYFFYTEWCPYSKKSEKIWDEIKKQYTNEDLKLNFIKIDCESDKKMASDYNIKEYPVLLLKKNGDAMKMYNGNYNIVKFDTIKQWLKDNVQ